jgi:type II secretory pathway component PulJ
MVIALSIIAVLLLISVFYLRRFMKDMAIVESDLIKEIRQMKEYLRKIHEKQL